MAAHRHIVYGRHPAAAAFGAGDKIFIPFYSQTASVRSLPFFFLGFGMGSSRQVACTNAIMCSRSSTSCTENNLLHHTVGFGQLRSKGCPLFGNFDEQLVITHQGKHFAVQIHAIIAKHLVGHLPGRGKLVHNILNKTGLEAIKGSSLFIIIL